MKVNKTNRNQMLQESQKLQIQNDNYNKELSDKRILKKILESVETYEYEPKPQTTTEICGVYV